MTYKDNSKCFDCSYKFPNCKICDFDKCINCNLNFVNINGSCKPCPSGKIIEVFTYQYLFFNLLGCEVCSDENTCLQCDN